MTAQAELEAGPRTYGGWREARGFGVGNLTARQCLIVLGAVIAELVVLMFSVPTGLWLAPAVAVVIAITVARWQGVPLTDAVLARARWWRARAAGWHEFRGGVVVDHPRAWQLPGVLAPTVLLSAQSHTGAHYGVVWNRRTGHMSATLRVAAASPWLADGVAADTWVANWGGWLSSLGYVPTIKWIAVTVDTAPEAGATMTDYLTHEVDPQAPATARAIMEQLAAGSPDTTAAVETRVTLTFIPSAGRRADALVDQLAELDRELESAVTALGSCGVTVLGRASPAHLAAVMRRSFDPATRGDVDRCLSGPAADELLSWDNAGPVAATEAWDHYRHDSGWSVSWALHEPPRHNVTSSVLAPLLAPGVYPKRVTLLYQPMPADAAGSWVENQTYASSFRASLNRSRGIDPSQRDIADHERAVRAAREEVYGAGVVSFGVYITATTTDRGEVDRMASVVEATGRQAKIRLRRMYGSQAVGFAATLPGGANPAYLADLRPR